MAQIPKKLVEKLNTMIPELGDYKLGTILQDCLDQIAGGGPGSLLVPVYPSEASYAASNSVTEGSFFADSTSKTLKYYVCGSWHDIDLLSLMALITANSSQITLNTADIVNLAAQIVSLTTALNTHNHDGVNTQRIEIKGQLVTGAMQGEVLFVDGGIVSCMAIDPTIDVLSMGNLIEDLGTGINFVDDCFVVTTVGGVAQIEIPSLKTAIVDISNNAGNIVANTASIVALTTSVAALNTNVAQNATDILDLRGEFLAHDHTGGVNGPQLDPIASVVSPDGAGTVVNGWILGADGAGGTMWINPATITGTANLVGQNIGNASASDVFIQVNGSDEFEFRKLKGECGITVSVDPTDDHLNIQLDFASMPDIGTAVDTLNDSFLIHDISTGLCSKTSVSNILAATTAYSAGKGLSLTFPTPLVGEFALDLSSVTLSSTLASLDPVNDFVVVYDDSASDCVKLPISELIHTMLPSIPADINDLDDVCTEASLTPVTIYSQTSQSGIISNIDNSFFFGGTFTATGTGGAAGFTLGIGGNSAVGDISVTLLGTTAGVPDDGNVIASSLPVSVTGLSNSFNAISFATTPFNLVAGTEYAVRVDTTALSSGTIGIRGVADVVTGNNYFRSSGGGAWTLSNNSDFYIDMPGNFSSPGAVAGDKLCFDGAKWVPGPDQTLTVLNELTDVCLDASNVTNSIYDQSTHSTDTISIVGGGFRAFTFTPTMSGTSISSIQLELFEQIAPTSGTVTVQIVETSGGLPDESVVIATSDPDALTGLPGSPSSAPRDFNFSTPFSLNAGTEYAVYFDASALVGGNIAIRSTGVSVAPGGSYFKSAALDPWNLNNDRDAYLVINETIVTPAPVAGDKLCFDGAKWVHKTPEDASSNLCEITGAAPGVVGDLVYNNAGVWTLADHNDGSGDAAATHMIVELGAGVFSIQATGPFDGLSGLVPGDYYWGDPATPGAYTATRPVTAGETENEVFRAISATKAELTFSNRSRIVSSSTSSLNIVQRKVLSANQSVVGPIPDFTFSSVEPGVYSVSVTFNVAQGLNQDVQITGDFPGGVMFEGQAVGSGLSGAGTLVNAELSVSDVFEVTNIGDINFQFSNTTTPGTLLGNSYVVLTRLKDTVFGTIG